MIPNEESAVNANKIDVVYFRPNLLSLMIIDEMLALKYSTIPFILTPEIIRNTLLLFSAKTKETITNAYKIDVAYFLPNILF